MKVVNQVWSIKKLIDRQESIEYQPLYQRGEAWRPADRQLLIDTVLRRYDVPKIYLRRLTQNTLYSFQVIDGQQRLTSIWRFAQDEFPIACPGAPPKPWTGKRFRELSAFHKSRFKSFELTVALVEAATDEEARELFARLQKGARLNQAELRNSIASNVTAPIRNLAENHAFFRQCRFSSKRFKHHDLAAHAIALELFGTTRNLKAADLREMFLEYRTKALPRRIVTRASDVLTYMAAMNSTISRCINTKWGFVDVYSAVSQCRARPDPARSAKRYREFEKQRLEFSEEPERLLKGRAKNEKLYKYIMFFKVDGGLAKNLAGRSAILRARLFR